MSRDFILVFSGGLVSLMTTLVVLFVMDYYYRRLDRERGILPVPPKKDDKPAVQPVAPLTAKPVEPPKPVTSTQPTQVEAPKPVVASQPTQVEAPKPVAPKPEPKPLPTYKPSGDSLLPPQLRKSATQEKTKAPNPEPKPKVEERKEPAAQLKEDPKPTTQEKESPKEEPKKESPHDSFLPPETMKK